MESLVLSFNGPYIPKVPVLYTRGRRRGGERGKGREIVGPVLAFAVQT